jgi:hypothetical protein
MAEGLLASGTQRHFLMCLGVLEDGICVFVYHCSQRPVNGGYPPFEGRNSLLFDDAFSDQRAGQGKYHILGLLIVIVECRSLATFFNFAINSLADRLLMEIEENVNGDGEKRRFSQIPFGNRKNLQSQIVVCDSRNRNFLLHLRVSS